MKRFPRNRFSFFHVVLVHGMVLLLLLTPCTQAGDILHMGGAASGGTTATSAAASGAAGIDTAAATAQAHSNAQDMLARNTMALNAVDAMQQAAHAAAAGASNAGANPNFAGQTLPNVPNGLGTGGLDIIGAPTGATAPVQSLQNAHTIVTIQQTQQQALLNWTTFNVGSDTTVKFDQSAGGADAGNWIAFNKITDPSGNPTQILGSIQAQGQVYLINQNGIIFGAGSEVNTHAMVASALPLNDNLVTRGLLNNPDSQFLFSANAQQAGTKGPTPAFTPPALPNTTGSKIGDVTVQTGAQITAPTSSANVGGRVVLVGPNVTNNGTISTPDGQTILAAGMEVGFAAHSSADPSLRGLDVYVGSIGSYGGTVTNAGLIEAPRGSVAIAGSSVNQNGFIDSSTSVAFNGRIDLLADYNAVPNINYTPSDSSFGAPFVYPSATSTSSTGIVKTGTGSVMQILPEWASTDTLVGTELALKSQINIQGLGVYLGVNSVILAPNANVAISAGIWDLQMVTGVTQEQFVASTGQVYLDQGATVDVSGSTAVSTSLSDYIATITLRAAELADSALQRNGSLRGHTITVDLRKTGVRTDGTTWVGTPLANLTGYLGLIQRNVGQLTLAGGTVTMTAGNSIVMQPGSVVDVSSGYQNFTGGSVATTQLVSSGNLVDISAADPSVAYTGIYTGTTTIQNTTWSTSSTTTGIFASNSHYEAAYSAGGSGGSLTLSSPTMALDGQMEGSNIIGQQQLTTAPLLSTLALQFQSQQDVRAPLLFPVISPTSPDISFQNSPSGQVAVGSFGLDANGTPLSFPAQRVSTVILSPGLLGGTQGFGSLSLLNNNGTITVPAGVTLAASPTGSITFTGANLDVEGQLSAPGGSLNLTAYNISPDTTALLVVQNSTTVVVPPTTNGVVKIGSAAVLSTAGLVVDNRSMAAAALTLPTQVARSVTAGVATYASTTQGGSISIKGYSVEAAPGSVLTVTGGLVADRAFTFGNAGTLSIQAGNDPLFTSLLGGHLTLDGSLQGFSGASGGSLVLQAPIIQVGGSPTYAGTLLLQPDFFSSGGFSQFTLKGLGQDITPPGGGDIVSVPGVLIAPATLLQPVVSSLTVNSITVGTSSSISLSTTVLPEGYRSPVKLSLLASGITGTLDHLLKIRGNVTVGAGSQIITDALGSVTLQAQTIEMLGQISAPAGTVSLSINGAGNYADNSSPVVAFATVHLGAASVISTAGKTVYTADPFNRRTGTVYAGGSIQVFGNIVADSGAVLNVSGATAVLDLTPPQAGMSLDAISQALTASYSVPTQVDSGGGTITLKGAEFLFSNATLLGDAGGPTAQGGSLVVSSGRFILGASDDKEISLQAAQDMSSFTQPVFTGGVLGQSLLTSGGTAIKAQGYFGATSFQSGGFDSLTLSGNVQFNGAVSLSASGSLHIADGGVLAADALVSLTAPYVALGRPLMLPTREAELVDPYHFKTADSDVPSYFGPSFGTGRLVVTADLIETGFLSLQNIGQASLTARQDLRGNGYLDVAGDLTLTAGQVYPTTASTFTITAYNYASGGTAHNGSVTIQSSGLTPQFPLSGGGRLNIYAATITQGGTLRAPLGTITLGWDGSGTAPVGLISNVAVPVAQQITLQSSSLTSVSAIDPLSGAGVSIPYGIILNGTSWIDPTGLDITTSGAPDKSILISSVNLATAAGSAIDIRGGGNLFGYQWVTGNGGTVDILASTTSFAIIPGYSSLAAPFAPYSTSSINSSNLSGDLGYASSSLKVGEKIYLNASTLNAAGSYTLLPARYALLPGALLISPSSGSPTDSLVKPGGAVLTSGYMFNGLNPAVSGSVVQQYEVASQNVVNVRAQYNQYLATNFLPAQQQSLGLPVTRTPYDGGYVLLSAQQTMQISGSLEAAGFSTGTGGRADINSPLDIVLALSSDVPALNALNQASPVKKLILDASLLGGWNAGSLLVGGRRSFGSSATTISVSTQNLTLNTGAALSGTEVILAASQTLTLAAGSKITQSGTQSTADSLVVNGNGALVRVSGVAGAQTSRTGVTSSALPQLQVAAGVTLSGPSITLDSSNTTTLDNSTVLSGQAINLSSGRISLLLNSPGSLQSSGSLVLGGTTLATLQSTGSLSLTSYTSIDLYGNTTGMSGSTLTFTGNLALHAGEIRGINTSGGTVNLAAQSLLLDNSSTGTVSTPGGMSGSLNLSAAKITIGQNALQVNQYSNVTLNVSNGILMQGSGAFSAQGNLAAITPFLTGSSKASQNLTAGGVLSLTPPSGPSSMPTTLGLGAQLTLTGTSIVENTGVYLPSGLITLHALSGSITVGGVLNASGTAQTFFDVVRYTDAGVVQLNADLGNVVLSAGGSVNLSAPGTGNAGSLGVSAPYGSFTVPTSGALYGQAAGTGLTGSFTLDVNSLVAAPSLTAYTTLNTALTGGSFSSAQNIRLRSGSVAIDGTVTSSTYMLSVDQGSITVNGTINASGLTGGTIQLISNGNLSLSGGSLLTVAGQTFSSAGKGGSISLESGAAINGVVGSGYVSILAGSTLDLSVASKVAGDVTTVGTSASRGQFSGTLHIRAPQTTSSDFIQVSAIQGTLKDPSNIVIEGYKLYTTAQVNAIIQVSTGTTTATGAITGATWKAATLKADALAFFGIGNASYTAMFARLVGGNAGIMALENQLTGGVVMIEPGIELDNTQGSITLGSNALGLASSSAYLNDWDLASYRFGPKSAPGVLTIRSATNLVLYNALSDGFQVPTTGNGAERMWLAPLMALSTLKPVNDQSWSFRLTAGSDFSAASFRAVLPGSLKPVADGSTVAPAPAGSLLLGKDAFNAVGGNSGGDVGALTRLAINPTNNTTTSGYSYFQVIRTGTGDIDIAVGGDVRLVNQFASIYTAGAQVSSGTTVFTAGDFVTPLVALASSASPNQGLLGSVQQLYAAQFSMAGGNVSVSALNDILHTTTDAAGNLLMDSERELPNNWLMRRDYVDSSGNYGAISFGTPKVNDTAASTAWWINFSNFFDGVAALGGGNVTLKAGRDVQNVDASTPTNARAPKGAATSTNLLELGGGDLVVQAGRNIDAGVYYVERGSGTLTAGGSITTNATRAPTTGSLSGGILTPDQAMTDPIYQSTWLPTTLFVGKSSFNVNARGNVLLGPVANTMLLPQGLTNRHWYKTYFSTYNDSSSITAASLGGNVTFRLAANTPDSIQLQTMLSLWMKNELEMQSGSSAFYLPWLRLAETDSGQFSTLGALFPSNLHATAYSGDINLVGNLTLAPSATGSLELLAAGAFNGLQPTGVSNSIVAGVETTLWASSTVNLSDADPKAIPSLTNPLSYYGVISSNPPILTPFNNDLRVTNATFLTNLNALFNESGSTTGDHASTQSKQTLHTKGLLHANDSKPVLLYAKGGSLSGLTLFSAKAAVILAQQDITDIAFYIQNVRSTDVSVVSSGRDIVAYNANSALRSQALSTGNFTILNETPRAGDIQISGPGSLQVLTGRNLDLGTGASNSDGTGVGITSIGNGRNPYLPFAGADVLLAAGMGRVAVGLSGTSADFTTFISQFASSPAGDRYLAEAEGILGILVDSTYSSTTGIRVSSVTPGGAADKAGVKAGDVILQIADKAVTSSYDDSYLSSGIPLGQATSLTVVRNGVTQELGVTPGSNLLNVSDPTLSLAQQRELALKIYYLVLRDAGRDHNNPDSPDAGTYAQGDAAIQALITTTSPGSIQTQTRDVRTKSGGDISILAPDGGLQLAQVLQGNNNQAPPGVITEAGGSISIFANNSINIGVSRIFTLKGGDVTIWSSTGDIAAGSSSKTVQSAPPTRVLIDPQSANVTTDLAGLATGGGIGVLATVAGVRPGNVDLIAPIGAVDAGDAGIRATGNLNIAATIVLNSANIAVGGASSGTPTAAAVAAPSLGGAAAAASAGAATTGTNAQPPAQSQQQQALAEEAPSTITVEVLGYGGGTGGVNDDLKRGNDQPGE